ncbi:hypothetical protein LSH36_667g01062 [Paralvinella palmiformis]|uniref:Fibronectin type-III domain-containing protein n=1 Tax=Paralvinella palmiformis TaxID=53620 RepID=A0AAD9J418_9ANNE|nr:hypothetical protein LSH36_667g01062 [Paralvinella palmiformis]
MHRTSSSVKLTWNQIRDDGVNLNNIVYKVLYRKMDNSIPFIDGQSLEHRDNEIQLTVTVDNLIYNTKYEFMVEAKISGSGSVIIKTYPVITCKTNCMDPVVPDNVLFISSTSSTTEATIFVSHSPIKEMFSGCDDITEVWLDYKLADDTRWTRESLPLSATTYSATPSSGEGLYQVMLVVQNNAGFVDSTGIHTEYVKGVSSSTQKNVTRSNTKVTNYWIIIGILAGAIIFLILILVAYIVHHRRSQVNKEKPSILPHPFVEQRRSEVSVGQYISTSANNATTVSVIGVNDLRIAEHQLAIIDNPPDETGGYLIPHNYVEIDDYLTPI